MGICQEDSLDKVTCFLKDVRCAMHVMCRVPSIISFILHVRMTSQVLAWKSLRDEFAPPQPSQP